TGFSHMISPKKTEDIVPPTISFNPQFNPFHIGTQEGNRSSSQHNHKGHQAGIPHQWDSLYEIAKRTEHRQLGMEIGSHPNDEAPDRIQEKPAGKLIFQLHNRFILSQIRSGFMLIDQQAAHERILFERFLQQLENHQGASQQSLFPQTVELNSADFALISDLLPDIHALGFQIRVFGKRTFVVEGIPADLGGGINESQVLEQLLEAYKNNQ